MMLCDMLLFALEKERHCHVMLRKEFSLFLNKIYAVCMLGCYLLINSLKFLERDTCNKGVCNSAKNGWRVKLNPADE